MDEIARQLASRAHQRLADVAWSVRSGEYGRIRSVRDEVAFIAGLPSVRYGELLIHSSGAEGLAFDVRERDIGLLLLDIPPKLGAGDEIAATGRVASVPVGDGLLGRVVDALGRPLDNGPSIVAADYWPVEREAPGLTERDPVHEPLHAGNLLLDALLPIGRGQRELLLGDRGTGKTAMALDMILAQQGGDVVCLYAAIGQQTAEIGQIVELLRAHGALEYTVVVASSADAPVGQRYLAPFAACAIGEFFMRRGRHVLAVLDDLTAHADAYRSISLLLERPPGREAYPADIFHLQARLLERATRLKDELGGGSLTALPIAHTQDGNIAAYIPTNLISITDGQIYFDSRRFNEGIRPAVDVGLSVSRIGGKGQPLVLRELAGDLRLLYAQLEELERFFRLGAELEPASKQRLERGRRLRELLKQRRLEPLGLGQEVAQIVALREGFLDAIPVDRIDAFKDLLRRHLETSCPDVLAQIARADEAASQIERLREAIARQAVPESGASPGEAADASR